MHGAHHQVHALPQEYLDMSRVKKVDLYENGTIAIVEAVSPELGNRVQRVRVQLPGTSQVGPCAAPVRLSRQLDCAQRAELLTRREIAMTCGSGLADRASSRA